MLGVACTTSIVAIAVTVLWSVVSVGVKVTDSVPVPAFGTVPAAGE